MELLSMYTLLMSWASCWSSSPTLYWKTGKCCRMWCLTVETSALRTQYFVVLLTKPYSSRVLLKNAAYLPHHFFEGLLCLMLAIWDELSRAEKHLISILAVKNWSAFPPWHRSLPCRIVCQVPNLGTLCSCFEGEKVITWAESSFFCPEVSPLNWL